MAFNDASYIQTYDFNTNPVLPIVGIASINPADVGKGSEGDNAETRVTHFNEYIKDIVKDSPAQSAEFAQGIGNNTNTVGGEEKFVYVSNGKVTATNTTIGNSSTPIYLKDGVFTACTEMAPGGITEIPIANNNTLGGIKTGYTTNDKNYKVSVDSNGNAYVNVPWTDTTGTNGSSVSYVPGSKNLVMGDTVTLGTIIIDGSQYTIDASMPKVEAGEGADGNATYTISIDSSGVIKLDGTGTGAKDSTADISSFVNTTINNKLKSYSTTDTKNTTGASNKKSEKRFLVGAKTQSESIVTTTDVSVFITASSEISAVDFIATSDERLKTFKDDISIDFNKIKEIPKKYFTFNDDPDKVRIGTSAQQLQKVYPELVVYDESNDSYHVNYANLSVVALAAIDKLHEEIEYLKYKINKLENVRS